MAGYRIILDTDIGDDIDDAFALALILKSPEIELAAVTTVLGEVTTRAEIVAALLEAAGHKAIPIFTGCALPFASRPFFDPMQRKMTYWDDRWERFKPLIKNGYAIETLLSEMRAGTRVLSIGPMSNVAAATRLEPRLSVTSGGMIAMCGEFQREGHIEYNIRCDPEAAGAAFATAIEIDVIPWSIGPATKLTDADVRRLEASVDPLVKLLVSCLNQFWQHTPGKTHMYDPMTIVALLKPELFDWRRGRVSVELRDEKLYGLTRFTPDENGPHRVAFGVKADEAKAFLLDRILGG